MLFWRRTLPLGITFVLGVVGAMQYYVPHPLSEKLLTDMSEWGRIIGGFAMILGVASLCHVDWGKIRRRVAGWGYSLVMYAAMVVTVAVGLAAGGPKGPLQEAGTAFGWIYTNMMVALQGTMFSILAFFVASAAYRAFRARTPEATVLLVAAIIVMLGRVPLGELILPPIQAFGEVKTGIVLLALFFLSLVLIAVLPIWPYSSGWGYSLSGALGFILVMGVLLVFGVGPVAGWILNVLNASARRAILIGISVGVIATSLKIICGIERGYLGGGRD